MDGQSCLECGHSWMLLAKCVISSTLDLISESCVKHKDDPDCCYVSCGRVLMCGHPCQYIWLEPDKLARPVTAQRQIWGHLCVSVVEVRYFRSSLLVCLLATNPIYIVPICSISRVFVLLWIPACGVPMEWPPLHVTWNCMLWSQKE
jgi:hypothetical protein